MDIKTNGIVLRIIKYNDRSHIVDVYSQELGRCAVLVNIAKSSKSKIKSNLFQPLSLLDFNLSKTTKSSLYRLRDVRSHYTFSSIPFHPIKSAIAFYIAEFLYYAIRDENVNRPLFDYLDHSMRWLDGSEAGFANFHLVFLIRLSRFLGLYPNYSDYHRGDYFDLKHACFCSVQPLHPRFLKGEEALFILKLMRMNYDSMHLFKFSRQERGRVLHILNDFYKLHIPNFPDLKSLDVLKELFED